MAIKGLFKTWRGLNEQSEWHRGGPIVKTSNDGAMFDADIWQ